MIEFKRVRESDLEIIMNWRSSRKISKYLITEVSKDMDQQKKWFDEKVRNKFPPEHWVIFLNKIPIGFISMENYIEKVKTSWGYYIGEKKYWHIGGLISAYFYNYIFFKRDKHLKKITGHYFSDHLKIRKLHQFYGCIETEVLSNHVEKDGVMHDIILMEMRKDVWLSKQDKFKSYIADFEE